MEGLRRNWKKAGKTSVLGRFCAEKGKNHWVFRRKTISTKPKAIRNQVTGHWDPLRNHRAEHGRRRRGKRQSRAGLRQRKRGKREKRGKRGKRGKREKDGRERREGRGGL